MVCYLFRSKMGNETRIYGAIQVPRWKGWERAIEPNLAVIDGLPDEGEWRWLIRGMFHLTPERVSYGNYLISFAAAQKGAIMPYVNIKVTKEGVTADQKAELINGVTALLVKVLGKNPATTVVVIDEVATDNWGIGDEPVTKRRLRGQ